MRLYAYYDDEGLPRVGRREGDAVVIVEGTESLSGLLVDADEDGAPLLNGPESRRVARSELEPAPAIEWPGKIVCAGLNYGEHVAEGGRSSPARPLLFSKSSNAVVADGEPIVRPEGSRALDLEVELGVVIGRTARRVRRTDAMAYVAGYVVLNDVSARDWQGVPAALAEGQKGDGQWLRAKGSDTFCPIGPDFVTTDEVDPKAGLRIRSWRVTPDGTEHLMQDGTTSDLLWDVPALIEYITGSITLEPGDIIATGTPGGVGVFRDPPVFLEPGDLVRCEIEGIGSVANPVIDWSELPAV